MWCVCVDDAVSFFRLIVIYHIFTLLVWKVFVCVLQTADSVAGQIYPSFVRFPYKNKSSLHNAVRIYFPLHYL